MIKWLWVLAIPLIVVACGGMSDEDCLQDLDCVADKSSW